MSAGDIEIEVWEGREIGVSGFIDDKLTGGVRLSFTPKPGAGGPLAAFAIVLPTAAAKEIATRILDCAGHLDGSADMLVHLRDIQLVPKATLDAIMDDYAAGVAARPEAAS